ncbi:MAG: IS200/IS605 family transposase [Candidatus Moranbacteria bacterium]|nr:IS200/IS605 family transposase [Candidatus Moranbacteria bacterium]
MAKTYQLRHCTYCCQYHIVFTTRYRNKVLSDNYIKQEFKRIFKSIVHWKGFCILQWHIGDEHIHLYVNIPPKYSISYVICILKAKSSTWIKRKTRKFPKGSVWSRGCFVSTIGINEFAVRRYIEKQRYRQIDISQANMF